MNKCKTVLLAIVFATLGSLAPTQVMAVQGTRAQCMNLANHIVNPARMHQWWGAWTRSQQRTHQRHHANYFGALNCQLHIDISDWL